MRPAVSRQAPPQGLYNTLSSGERRAGADLVNANRLLIGRVSCVRVRVNGGHACAPCERAPASVTAVDALL